jgi:DNA-binding XRE family transcriptional regulator
MSEKRVYRKIQRTPEERARLLADRERYQRERPTPEQLLASGGHQEFVTLGEMLAARALAASLKQERERQQLTLADVAKRTGMDQAALSRIENGKNANPTLDTLVRIAAALGKVIRWSLEDARRGPVAPA